jgi:DNA-binding IscR family transcriptional regulator
MREVVEALEGSLNPIDCLDGSSPCSRAGGCAQRPLWEEVREATIAVLERATLADLVERERPAVGGRYYI